MLLSMLCLFMSALLSFWKETMVTRVSKFQTLHKVTHVSKSLTWHKVTHVYESLTWHKVTHVSRLMTWHKVTCVSKFLKWHKVTRVSKTLTWHKVTCVSKSLTWPTLFHKLTWISAIWRTSDISHQQSNYNAFNNLKSNFMTFKRILFWKV